jgi:hypothetical protein
MVNAYLLPKADGHKLNGDPINNMPLKLVSF